MKYDPSRPPHKPLPIGTRFGKLVTIEPTKGVLHYVQCQCDCGQTKAVLLRKLKEKHTPIRSCGCLLRTANRKHGLCSRSKPELPEYAIWSGMRTRCNNPNRKSYKDYGARGIKICARWDDFANFYADMGQRPSPKHTIERLDNDGGYEPSNCVWATRKVQNVNTRQNRFLEVDGVCRTVSQWAELLTIPVRVLRNRVTLGWSAEDIVKTPWTPNPKLTETHARRRAARNAA